MKFLVHILHFLFPLRLVKNSAWHLAWQEKSRADNLFVWRSALPIFAFGYAIHIYIDQLHHKPNIDLWITFRISMTALTLTCFALYLWPAFYKSRFYKLPIYVFVFAACYFQARSVLWYSLVPYSLALQFVFIGAMILRGSILQSLAFALVMFAFQWGPLREAGVPAIRLVSECALAICCIFFARASFLKEVRSFISSQKELESQKHMTHLSHEFTNQIKRFLPAEIANRLTAKITIHKMTAIEAMTQVLEPQKLQIACLYSDVRGFTEQSKDLDGFVKTSLLPNLEGVTKAIEDNHGIPRKTGDLIFSYFDDQDPAVNIHRALQSAIRLVELNMAHNLHCSRQLKIKRHTLMSFGPAVVGNLNSNLSSIEISAIGTPVNILSRMDELVKREDFQRHLEEIDIVMPKATALEILKIHPTLEFKLIDLQSLNLAMRNFADETILYVLPAHEINKKIMSQQRGFAEKAAS